MGEAYTVVWDIFLQFILEVESFMFARELTLLPPALFYPFLPISISTHPQSEDGKQIHMDSIYFSPDLGVLVRLLRIWLTIFSFWEW